MTIFYELFDSLYVNITNRCPCHCDFCIRSHSDHIKESGSMWLTEEPTLKEICEDFDRWKNKPDFSKFRSIVFCGYGEPLERIDDVTEICRYLKKHTSLPIRINTNGLSDLIHQRPTAQQLQGLVDTVSISLNAPNAEAYDRLCHPVFGLKAFPAILDFAVSCKEYVPHVMFTVVDTIGEQAIEECREIASSLGVGYRVRSYIDQY